MEGQMMPEDPMVEEAPTEGQMQGEDKGSVFVSQLIQDVPPEKVKQLEVAQHAIAQFIYDPRTKDKVKNMLRDRDPQMAIPMATNAVFGMFEEMQKKGQKRPMPLEIRLALGVSTFKEILDVGAGLGIIPKMDLEEAQPMLKAAMQQYIQKGLKDKTIDPIELQEKINPLMTEEEGKQGMEAGAQYGVPEGLQQEQVNERMVQQRTEPLRLQQEQLMKENEKYKGALQGIASQEG